MATSHSRKKLLRQFRKTSELTHFSQTSSFTLSPSEKWKICTAMWNLGLNQNQLRLLLVICYLSSYWNGQLQSGARTIWSGFGDFRVELPHLHCHSSGCDSHSSRKLCYSEAQRVSSPYVRSHKKTL